MNLIFFDDQEIVTNLRPFTFTRPVCDIRMGMLTIRDKWQGRLGIPSSSNYTEPHLEGKYPLRIKGENLCINSSVLPDAALVKAVQELTVNRMLFKNGLWLAGIFTDQLKADFDECNMDMFQVVEYEGSVEQLKNTYDIFSLCGKELVKDFETIVPIANRQSDFLAKNPGVTVIGDPTLIYCEPGAVVQPGCILNTTGGPIYLGAGAEIMEGCMVRGPFFLGEHGQLKMGAKIYGPSTFGPHCKVGGEVNNSVLFGYSSKAHDGFLGNSVLGEWCNLGADTNNSNLKNNYAEVKLWHYGKQSFVKTGLQFCGLMMGDHSKCAINTMFNTGTVVGVSANIFGDGFPRNYIPSFSWGGAAGMIPYKVNDAITTAKLVYQRRSLDFDETEQEIFRYLYSLEYPS